MSINPYKSPTESGKLPTQKMGRLKRRLVELLAVVGAIVVLGALLLPNVRSAREPARRGQCTNNLKHISLALKEYESVYHFLPPAYTVDAEGKRLHSWRTLILPYLEQGSLYEKIDLSKPWDDPANREARETELSVYRCPSADGPANRTSYLAVVAPDGCFRATGPRKLSEITDDPDWTLMVIDVDSEHGVHWISPEDVNEQWMLNLGAIAKWPHPGGAQAVSVSGRVHFLNRDLNAAALRALISVDGRDDAVASETN